MIFYFLRFSFSIDTITTLLSRALTVVNIIMTDDNMTEKRTVERHSLALPASPQANDTNYGPKPTKGEGFEWL